MSEFTLKTLVILPLLIALVPLLTIRGDFAPWLRWLTAAAIITLAILIAML